MRPLLLLFSAVGLLCTPRPLYAQAVLEMYIRQGLDNNLVLQEKRVALDQSLLALRYAKSLFLPTTWFEGQYTVAKGGRSIDIPVGDLLNPVYQTLNQLTGSPKFPQISNVSEQFLPNNFYDVRVKTTLPIINPDLQYNRSISQQQTQLARYEIDIYRRELVKDIKVSYYNLLQATKAVAIYQNALEVVREHLRVNESLHRNGRNLPAYIIRSESEVQQVESQLLQARNQVQNAQAYFNFLRNKPLTDSIEVVNEEQEAEWVLPPLLANNAGQREELQSLRVAAGINTLVSRMNRSYRTPRLNGFVDFASQGFNFRVDNKSLFYLAGVQVQVPIFSGQRNQIRISQTGLEGKAIALKKDHTEQQLELAVMVSRNNALSTYNSYQASRKQLQAAQQYFRLVEKGYREGINNFVEFLDARNNLTNAQLQVNVQRYKVLAALADFERQTASYTFN